jgi:hypothetical protein
MNEEEIEITHEFSDYMAEHKVLQLKNNFIPKGMVPLEQLFDRNDVPVKPTVLPKDDNTEECNIGTEKEPKYIKLSKEIPGEHKEKYLQLFKEYMDVFSWKYEDLKTYDTNIIQHRIPLKPGTKPFRKKLRKVNPLLFPTIEKEVRKLLDAQIIIPLRYSEWVENLVPVRKKSGEIRLCVDFRNLNKFSLKDNYPFPKMDHILQKVVGENIISMMDGFSGYNQVAMHPEDRENTTFTTPWGTFMYDKIPFGLINAGATFQQAMDIDFVGEKDRFIVIYLDDMIVFSKTDEDHIRHLRKTFMKCRKFGLSLNPKKSYFSMTEGNILGI